MSEIRKIVAQRKAEQATKGSKVGEKVEPRVASKVGPASKGHKAPVPTKGEGLLAAQSPQINSPEDKGKGRATSVTRSTKSFSEYLADRRAKRGGSTHPLESVQSGLTEKTATEIIECLRETNVKFDALTKLVTDLTVEVGSLKKGKEKK